ncbi:response regulator transcription factor [Fulvivirgaceae bacterium PWU4]|uniref:Response regulator transcription factor n=1 Tax=Chryseosolibacter histidini TaxID=2782349 RepID=A0AAP2DJX3_9BACT|nr:response regulator transcription factor [Chryseosolibacter histidini]MBT1697541.1 response regulator transcription factor [Chryseosolibacter histidini]
MSPKSAATIVKVVTVEDSLVVAERVQSLLVELANIRFLGNARSVPEALELISSKKPDVVILDIHLGEQHPGGNGLHLLITLRRQYRRMKLMMLTNLTDPQYRRTCMTLGADYFFDKSNDFDKVSEVLKNIQL